MRWLIAGIIGALLVLALLAGDGADGARYEAERTQRVQAVEAERTQRTAIEQAAQTERTAINAQQLMWLATEREATLRLVVVLLVVIVAVAGVVVVAVLVLRRTAAQALLPYPQPPPPPPPPDAQRVLRRLPGHSLDYDPAEGWVVVVPGGREYYTLPDARRLIEQRR